MKQFKYLSFLTGFKSGRLDNHLLQTCTNILGEICLQVNHSIVIKDHIDVLLQSEKLERKEGFLERMSMLKRAELQESFNRFREDINKLI
jgi:hypothetical protein